MDYEQMTAPCGLACFECPLYIANQDQELQKNISNYFEAPAEAFLCKGCRNENGIIPYNKNCQSIKTEKYKDYLSSMNGPCDVYKCIQTKDIKFCSDCSDFPCDNLHPYSDQAHEKAHNMKVFNLCLIKKMGLEAWAKGKAKSVREKYFKGQWEI